MKVVELLKIGGEMLKLLSRSDATVNDYQFVPMYEEFQQMRKQGVKYRVAVRLLSEDYHIGRATVERVLKRLGEEC